MNFGGGKKINHHWLRNQGSQVVSKNTLAKYGPLLWRIVEVVDRLAVVAPEQSRQQRIKLEAVNRL